jgi:hypothetical protein
MRSSVHQSEPRAMQVEVTDDELQIMLVDGRRVFAPLVWYPRLLYASDEHRQNWRLIGDGQGIHWPDIDEDVSVAGVLEGIPSLESPKSLREYVRRTAGDGSERVARTRNKARQSATGTRQ